jgi:4-hydroxybenzoate polyprenyltransferase
MKIINIINYIKIARFDHYIKQLFILPGIFFAYIIVNDLIQIKDLFLNLILCLISTSFIASANYIINEWLDADFDKYHPTKKFRPAVTNGLKYGYIICEYIIFAISGLIISYYVNRPVLITEVILLVMGILYNINPIRLKEYPFIDVLSESINNAIRLLVGWFIVAPHLFPPISIILGYWMGGAFLMSTKRFAEYRMIKDKQLAIQYRKSFKFYTENSLLISSFYYSLLSVFFCGIFMLKYRIELLLSIPFLCGIYCLYFNISFKYDSSAQKPEKLFREKFLMVYIFIFICIIIFLMIKDIKSLNFLLDTTLIKY